jgi:hypothetical protein
MGRQRTNIAASYKLSHKNVAPGSATAACARLCATHYHHGDSSC